MEIDDFRWKKAGQNHSGFVRVNIHQRCVGFVKLREFISFFRGISNFERPWGKAFGQCWCALR